MTFKEFLEFWPDENPLRTAELRVLAEKHGWMDQSVPAHAPSADREMVSIAEAHRHTGISPRTLRYNARAWAELTEAGRPSPVYAVRTGAKPSSPLQVDLNELKRIAPNFGRRGKISPRASHARRRGQTARANMNARVQENISRVARRRS